MTNVLITAANGNIGSEILKKFQKMDININVFAGITKESIEKFKFSKIGFEYREFDFAHPPTFKSAFADIDILFLLLPPNLPDYKATFHSIVNAAQKIKVKHVIYMSVQGAEKNKFIPHHTIEKIIESSDLDFTFLRPAYFMQNFVTTLKDDIKRKIVYLPAGRSKFSLVDIRDIANVTCKIIVEPQLHNRNKYDLTSDKLLNFNQMTDILSSELNYKIKFLDPNPIIFIYSKLKNGNQLKYILILILLHYLPRFQKPPTISNSILRITGKLPISFEQFAKDYKELINKLIFDCSQ